MHTLHSPLATHVPHWCRWRRQFLTLTMISMWRERSPRKMCRHSFKSASTITTIYCINNWVISALLSMIIVVELDFPKSAHNYCMDNVMVLVLWVELHFPKPCPLLLIFSPASVIQLHVSVHMLCYDWKMCIFFNRQNLNLQELWLKFHCCLVCTTKK